MRTPATKIPPSGHHPAVGVGFYPCARAQCIRCVGYHPVEGEMHDPTNFSFLVVRPAETLPLACAASVRRIADRIYPARRLHRRDRWPWLGMASSRRAVSWSGGIWPGSLIGAPGPLPPYLRHISCLLFFSPWRRQQPPRSCNIRMGPWLDRYYAKGLWHPQSAAVQHRISNSPIYFDRIDGRCDKASISRAHDFLQN
jgi:hypothetical protein